ncbi:hypothetical protein [Chitinophaga fulva]|nr:hypothetical protein [Chitinophaga fulva]
MAESDKNKQGSITAALFIIVALPVQISNLFLQDLRRLAALLDD